MNFNTIWKMIKKYNLSNFFKALAIFLPIVTFIIGAVGGEVVETLMSPLFDTNTKAILTISFIACLLTVILLIVITIFTNLMHKQNSQWLKSVGTPAELIAGKARAGEYHEKLKQLLQEVTGDDVILVITNHRRKKTGPDDQNETRTRVRNRQKYLEYLLEIAKQKDFTYRRILCFDETPTIKGEVPKDLLPTWLAEHCRKILEIKESKTDKISLQMSRTRLSGDIFVVRKKFGTMFFRLYNPYDKRTDSEGASFIFHYTPNSQVVDMLDKWFNEIRNYDVTENVISIP